MVLGQTTKRRKLPRGGSWPPMAPKLPGAPSLYPDVSPYPGATHTQKPNQICPLVETGEEFGPTWVPKPFSLLELKTWEAIWMIQANI